MSTEIAENAVAHTAEHSGNAVPHTAERSAVDQTAFYDQKTILVKAELKSAKQKVYNFDRPDRVGLDHPRKARVERGDLTEEQAVEEANEEAQNRVNKLQQELKQLAAQKQMALLQVDVAKQTALIPGMKTTQDDMRLKLDDVHAALCNGELHLDPKQSTQQGKHAIRYAKATLTNRFQAYSKRPDATCAEVDAEFDELQCVAEQKAEHVKALKQTWADKDALRARLQIDVQKLKATLDMTKGLGRHETDNKVKKALELKERLLTAARQQSKTAKQEYGEARPAKKAKSTLQQLEQDADRKQLEANLSKAKENLCKAMNEQRDARQQRGCSKSDLTKKTHAAKISKADKTAQEIMQAAVVEHKRCQAILGASTVTKCDAEQQYNKVARDLKHYKQFGELPPPAGFPAEAPAAAASSSASAEAPAEAPAEASGPTAAAAYSSADASKRSHKRKADQVDMTDLPPGANRLEKSKLARARQAPDQAKLGDDVE